MDHPRISQNPDAMVGKPVIRGTRIPVELILRMLSGGHTIEAILDSYPRLTREDVLAAPAFAADFLNRSAPGSALNRTELHRQTEDGLLVFRDPSSLVDWLRAQPPLDEELPVIEDRPSQEIEI